MKIWQFLKWLKADAIITIEPQTRQGYFIRKMKKKNFSTSYQAMKIEQLEIVDIQFNDIDNYGIIIAVKEESLESTK